MSTKGEQKRELLQKIDVDQIWNRLEFTEKIEPSVDDHPGWKTVRIFVSSTFKDFHQEREELIKRTFADLRAWCEGRQLHLIDCDLRWGIPQEATVEMTLKICLEEIDRCYADNRVPYFVNMTCKRVGWIPLEDDIPSSLLKYYQLVFGLSVTEMEIVHAAYRIENPNALFLIRDDSFLQEIEDERIKKEFIDEQQPIADQKLNILKEKIMSHFAVHDQVKIYKCKYIPGGSSKGRPMLELDGNFSEMVLGFFKKRIDQQYPEIKANVDRFLDAKYHHEAFMQSRCEIVLGNDKKNRREMILGREDILKEIADYIADSAASFPKLIVGEAGSGKSSILAKATSEALEKYQRSSERKVFFHFVGAVPNSTSLSEILTRLLKELQPEQDVPEKLDETLEVVKRALEKGFKTPVVIFIDALNQIDNNMKSLFWLPDKLASNVHCVLSLITESEPHKELKRRKVLPSSAETVVPALNIKTKMEIVKSYLSLFNKKLESEQLGFLVEKKSSTNPLWLRIACEELRIYGDFRTVTAFIENIADGLPELLKQVLTRFEKETDPILLVSTLCLLEVSRFGLLETELLEILADKDNLKYREIKRENVFESNVIEKGRRLPAMEWASVYRNLRIFLRPYGNPSEGRLDFYHRTLSKVVREMYLSKDSKECEDKFWWWHKKLADFYSKSGVYDRKVEEYPHHLLQLKKYAKSESEKQQYCQQLQDFLLKMEAFNRLYDDEFSGTLLYYWRESGDESYNKMTKAYLKVFEDTANDLTDPTEVKINKWANLSRLLVQAGKYKDGLDLAQKCLQQVDELKNSAEKNDQLMYLYGDIAHIKSMTMPPVQSPKDIAQLEEIISYSEKAVQLITNRGLQETDRKYKKYQARLLLKAACARAGIASRCDISFLSSIRPGLKRTKKEMLEQGFKEAKEAIKIYNEINDFGHEVEAQMALAILNRGNRDAQLEIYKEARKQCRQFFGKEHHLMCRLCFNTAIVYEDAKEYEDAYKYFRKAFIIACQVFGSDHSQTNKYKNKLKEGKFPSIAKKKGDRID